MNPDSAKPLSECIAALGAKDRRSREEAARELHRRGSAAAEAEIAQWRANPRIAALISGQATVGIAVTRERFTTIREAIGNPPLAEVPPDQDAEEFEWNLGGGVQLDILTSHEPGGTGAIARFLAKSGEGIQQVEFETPDVDRATELIRANFRIAPIYPATRPGADGSRVNFFLLEVLGGKKILIELVEPAKKH